jgi:hypothetical protein
VQRILRQLDETAPKGNAEWNGRLVAEALGDVSPDAVWRVLRQQRIQQQRRRSWCISTDAELIPKATDIVGLYLKRLGTGSYSAALNGATGQVQAGHYRRRRRREFLDFLNEVVAQYPDHTVHVILDNL